MVCPMVSSDHFLPADPNVGRGDARDDTSDTPGGRIPTKKKKKKSQMTTANHLAGSKVTQYQCQRSRWPNLFIIRDPKVFFGWIGLIQAAADIGQILLSWDEMIRRVKWVRMFVCCVGKSGLLNTAARKFRILINLEGVGLSPSLIYARAVEMGENVCLLRGKLLCI